MPTLVRPRIATLSLRLDLEDRPAGSDLVLATREGEVVWRGEVSTAAWLLGLRMRGRCTGSREDAQWLLVRALLEAELATHGLHRDGRRDLPVDLADGADGTVLTTRCGVVPLGPRLDTDAPAHGDADEHVRRAGRAMPVG